MEGGRWSNSVVLAVTRTLCGRGGRSSMEATVKQYKAYLSNKLNEDHQLTVQTSQATLIP